MNGFRTLGGTILFLALLAAALAAEANRSTQTRETEVETFDLSGFPAKDTTFDEQQVRELVRSHEAGNLREAVRIQGKLAGYYAGKGDERRAALARAREVLGERLLAEPSPPPGPEPAPRPDPKDPGGKPEPEKPKSSTGWSGKYFAMDGGTLHTWEFAEDGTYLYTTATRGAGTSVRNSERGTYSLELEKGKGTISLTVKSEAGGFVTPGAGQGTILGGGSEKKDETRRLSFEFKGDRGFEGILLEGKPYKPKRW